MTKTCIDINGPWEFREYPETARKMDDLNQGRWLSTSHPESIFLSLAEAGILQLTDLYTSPETFGWVARQAWVFRTRFDLGPEPLSSDHAELVFEGLDSITQIWLNEKKLGNTDNAFITHRFDAADMLRPGQNTLLIKFCVPEKYAERLISKYGSPNDSSVCHPARVFVRKPQCQFGSAMGPALLDCGITRPLRLERIGAADLADIHIRTIDCNPQYADMRVAVSIRRFAAAGIPLQCRLTIEGGDQPQTHLIDPGANDIHSAVIRIPSPQLWWPRGYGSPHLYTLRADLVAEDRVLDSRQLSFGIRMIRTLKTKDSDTGGFGIEINQQSIYAKGVVWLPVSLLADSTNREKISRLIQKLADTHINMIRVWGGGTYEDDHFYNLCDQLGILVWQDFMFASACYPDYEGFIDLVGREAQAVILRLRNHPCIAVWSGNSHIDRLCQSGKISKSKKAPSKEIFHQLLPDLLSELNPDCDYIPSVPEPHLAGKAPTVTDLWQSWNDYQSMDSWIKEPLPPFVIETGFQSMPSIQALAIACPAEEQVLAGPGIEKLNYHTEGMQRLARFISDSFVPPRDLAEQIYQTQIVQARAMKNIVETLRVHNTLNRGALIWSAGDFWPAAGFSMLDFRECPKALFFYARRFWAPILICLGPSGSTRNAFVVNDTPSALIAQARFRLLDMKGGILDQSQSPVSVSPYGTASISLPRDLVNPVWPEKSILHMAVYQDDHLLSENTSLFAPDKYAQLRPLDLDITVESIDASRLRYSLVSRYFVKDLEIALDTPVVLSDNFLDLLPGRRYELVAEFPDTTPDIRRPFVLRSSCRP